MPAQSCSIVPTGVGQLVRRHHPPGEHRADERPDAPQDERDEPLRRAAHPLVRLVVHVELPGDEQEVVADAVQQDGGEDQRASAPRAAESTLPASRKYRAAHARMPMAMVVL